MINSKKISFIYANLGLPIFLFWLFSLFFPIKYVFLTPEAYLTGQYSDFTSFSLYLCDILMILVFLIYIPRETIRFRWSLPSVLLGILIFLIIMSIFVNSSLSKLEIYHFSRFLLLIIVAYGTLPQIIEKYKIKFLWFFAFLCSIQSVLAILQFSLKSSLGLGRLGESQLSTSILGVAKMVLEGEVYIRGYGTFPHPNLLAAFLMAGTLICSYLLFLYSDARKRTGLVILLFLNIVGLTVTFSRAGLLALLVALAVFFGYKLWKGSEFRLSLKIGGSVLGCLLLSSVIFYPFLVTRATWGDSAVLERAFYSEIGLEIIKEHPWFGVGIGESLLHMKQFSPIVLEPWQIQPIHHYFLLVAAEWGIIASTLLFCFFVLLGFRLYKTISSASVDIVNYRLLLFSILIGFFVLMQFDHYFYTLPQTQILLWMTLGLVARETKTPQLGS